MPFEIEQSFNTAIPFPAIAIGLNGRVETANEKAFALFGDQIVGHNYASAFRQPGLLEKIEDSLRSSEKNIGIYTTTIDQQSVTFNVHIAPITSGFLATFVDTTGAEKLNSFRRDFVANVSHELRTPLASVLGFVETLRGHAKDDPKARERFLEIIERETLRMSSLVDDLLSLSRVEEEARKRPTTPVQIAALITRSVSELEPIITKANATISVVDESDSARANVDAGQLHQVMSNLIENAIRYGETGGPVNVKISRPAHDQRLRTMALRISIENKGDGIPAHHLPRLTERFYRVDSHRSREVGGTGLGLAIVKHIVQRHRGRLAIESTVGKSSTFTVILPILTEK